MPRPELLLCLALAGCGGKVVVDTAAEGDTSGAGASGGAGPTATVAASTSISSTAATSGGSCEGQMCGAYCEVCAPDCVSGHCDGEGACAPEVQGGPGCPPADQVVSGIPCSTESLWCPSEQSCSGYLVCICGAWVLVNPC